MHYFIIYKNIYKQKIFKRAVLQESDSNVMKYCEICEEKFIMCANFLFSIVVTTP